MTNVPAGVVKLECKRFNCPKLRAFFIIPPKFNVIITITIGLISSVGSVCLQKIIYHNGKILHDKDNRFEFNSIIYNKHSLYLSCISQEAETQLSAQLRAPKN
jgi:hypothetical protein